MPRGTPQDGAAKWANRLSAASTDVAAGVDRVSVAPGQLAAQKADKWFQAIQASQAKWKANVAAVPLETWKTNMKTIGIPRIATGATAKQGKWANFASKFYPHLDALASKLASMPDTTYEQRKARAIAAMDHNHTFTMGQ